MIRRPALRVFLPQLILVALLATVTAARAEANNPNTDWFQQAGWGVFVHYLESLQNNPAELHSLGKKTSWDECVKEFDVEKLADQIAQTRAGYVIFTMQQRTRFLILRMPPSIASRLDLTLNFAHCFLSKPGQSLRRLSGSPRSQPIHTA